jgi:AraC-like DNA-binding protein
MERNATVGGLQVLQGIEALSDLGVPSRLLHRIVGLDAATLERGVRVPLATVRDLFAFTERSTGDALAGLHAAERIEFRGPLAYLVMSCPQLRQGLELYCRFSRIAVDTQRQVLEEDGAVASLVFDPGSGTPRDNRHLMDYIMMGTVRTLRRAAGRGLHLLEVRVRHTARGSGAEAARVFGCPVRFEQPEYRVIFPTSVLDTRSRMSNPVVGQQLEKLVAALTASAAPAEFRARVEATTRTFLAAGHRPDAAMVAKRMHVSPRTLQRRLEEEKTTFKAARDTVLREIVEAQLRSPVLSIKEIAASVAFADVATFSKAFRRWTGHSPSTFRARILGRRVVSLSSRRKTARRPSNVIS